MVSSALRCSTLAIALVMAPVINRVWTDQIVFCGAFVYDFGGALRLPVHKCTELFADARGLYPKMAFAYVVPVRCRVWNCFSSCAPS